MPGAAPAVLQDEVLQPGVVRHGRQASDRLADHLRELGRGHRGEGDAGPALQYRSQHRVAERRVHEVGAEGQQNADALRLLLTEEQAGGLRQLRLGTVQEGLGLVEDDENPVARAPQHAVEDIGEPILPQQGAHLLGAVDRGGPAHPLPLPQVQLVQPGGECVAQGRDVPGVDDQDRVPGLPHDRHHPGQRQRGLAAAGGSVHRGRPVARRDGGHHPPDVVVPPEEDVGVGLLEGVQAAEGGAGAIRERSSGSSSSSVRVRRANACWASRTGSAATIMPTAAPSSSSTTRRR
ncbi:hypothetical protein SMICM17S_09440 [Streptomyces microflavus]